MTDLPIPASARSQAGFLSLDAMGAILTLLMLLPALATLIGWGLSEVEKRGVADHLSSVAEGFSGYVQENRSTLLVEATTGNAVSVPMQTLKNGGYLPAALQERNAWNQEYRFYVLQPADGELQGLVLTTGGRGHSASRPEFGNTEVPSAAAMAGGMGGFVPTGALPGQSVSVLRGAYGGWTLDIASTNIPNPGPGHLAALISLTKDSLAQDYLYRVTVPGHPELNQMSTDLDMTGHAITDVGAVQFRVDALEPESFCTDSEHEGRMYLDTEEGLYLCRSGQAEVVADSGNSVLLRRATVAMNGATITKPACPAGTDTTPSIFVSPSIVAEGPQANALVAVQAWASDAGDDWQVHMRVLTTRDEWVSPPENYGRMTVITTCN